jgi:hypothetical protein
MPRANGSPAIARRSRAIHIEVPVIELVLERAVPAPMLTSPFRHRHHRRPLCTSHPETAHQAVDAMAAALDAA